MLYINFGELPDEIKHPSVFFKYEYEDEWFNDEYVRKMIRDIDKSEVISSLCINSPVLGPITFNDLSNSVKNLILAYKTDYVIDASFCGDNCSKWLVDIATKKDLTITLYHLMDFPDNIHAIILNSNKEVKGREEYIWEAVKVY